MFLGRTKRLVANLKEYVYPQPGAIVFCDLALGSAEHSGVYIGHDQIVELSGDGNIQCVSYKQFRDGDILSPRTGVTIYLACDWKGNVLSDLSIAERARRMVNTTRDYHLLFDNCHQFTAGCITGDFENPINFMSMLNQEIRNYHNSTLEWRVLKEK